MTGRSKCLWLVSHLFYSILLKQFKWTKTEANNPSQLCLLQRLLWRWHHARWWVMSNCAFCTQVVRTVPLYKFWTLWTDVYKLYKRSSHGRETVRVLKKGENWRKSGQGCASSRVATGRHAWPVSAWNALVWTETCSQCKMTHRFTVLVQSQNVKYRTNYYLDGGLTWSYFGWTGVNKIYF